MNMKTSDARANRNGRRVPLLGIALTVAAVAFMGVAVVLVFQMRDQAVVTAQTLTKVIPDFQKVRQELGIFEQSENDPAFGPHGMLTAEAHAERCPSVAAKINGFEDRWVNRDAIEGHPLHDHAMIAAITQILEEQSYQAGCATRDEVLATARQLRQVEARDLTSTTFSTLVFHTPLVWNHGPVSMATLAKDIYEKSVGVKEVEADICRADMSHEGIPANQASAVCAART